MKSILKSVSRKVTGFVLAACMSIGIIGAAGIDAKAAEVQIAEGCYFIKSSINPEYVIDIEGASQNDAANTLLWQFNGGLNQVFNIKHVGGGYYEIIAAHSGKCLDVYYKYTHDTANIVQHTINGGDNQLWSIEKSGDYVMFKSKHSGKYLDVSGARAANGTNIHIYSGNNTPAQKFVLSRAMNGNGSPVSAASIKPAQVATVNNNQALVNYAQSQIGVSDYYGNNNVVYNTWYWGKQINGSGYAWCQAFVSYCANQVGILNTQVPKTASCSTAVKWYKDRGRFQYRSNYTPKAGDLVFYGTNGSSHVGIITAAPVDGYLQVVEGNVRDDSTGHYRVTKFTKNSRRRVDNSYVYGYGVTNY